MSNTIILRKVLLLRLSSIGDIILATPFIRCLAAAHAGIEIHVALRPEYLELLVHHPSVARCIPIDVNGGRNGLYRINHALASEHYDAVFDLHNNHRTRVLRNGLSARLRVVNKKTIRRFLLVMLKWKTLPTIVPVAEKYILTGRPFGVVPDGKGPEMYLGDGMADAIRTNLTRYGVGHGSRCIAMCPGARHFTKRWPRESFHSLAELILTRSDRHILVLGGADDAPLGAALERRDRRIVNLCGSLSLLETAAAMDACEAVVSNDSGLMHMATARAIPVVAIFGSTVKEFGFFPYNTPSRVIEADGVSCRPCSHIGRARCPKGHFSCMRKIGPETVWHHLAELIGMASSSDRR